MDLRKRSPLLSAVAAGLIVVVILGGLAAVVFKGGDDDDGDGDGGSQAAGPGETTTTTEPPAPVDSCELLSAGKIEDVLGVDVGDAVPSAEPASLEPHFCMYEAEDAFQGGASVSIGFYPAPAGEGLYQVPVENATSEPLDGVGDEGTFVMEQGGGVQARALVDAAYVYVRVSGEDILGDDASEDRDRAVELLKSALSNV